MPYIESRKVERPLQTFTIMNKEEFNERNHVRLSKEHELVLDEMLLKLSNDEVKSNISQIVARQKELKDSLDQLKLRVLNAAVEAAAAGAAGKAMAEIANDIDEQIEVIRLSDNVIMEESVRRKSAIDALKRIANDVDASDQEVGS